MRIETKALSLITLGLLTQNQATAIRHIDHIFALAMDVTAKNAFHTLGFAAGSNPTDEEIDRVATHLEDMLQRCKGVWVHHLYKDYAHKVRVCIAKVRLCKKQLKTQQDRDHYYNTQ